MFKNVQTLVIMAKSLSYTLLVQNAKKRTKHTRLKNPNWREADQLHSHRYDQRVELGSTETQFQLISVARVGLRSTSGFQAKPNALPRVHAASKSITSFKCFEFKVELSCRIPSRGRKGLNILQRSFLETITKRRK